MNRNQQTNQSSNPNSAQPGQADPQAGQSSQDNRYADTAQGVAGQGQQGQQGQQRQTQGGQGQGQGREVAAAGRSGGQLASAQSTTTLLPPVDIYEDESGFTVIADLPGVSKDQLVVRVTGDNLLIEGTAAVPVNGDMELVYGEVQTPQYRRNFTLSRELNPGNIEANLSNGVLRLRIPKAEEAKPRRIEVKVG